MAKKWSQEVFADVSGLHRTYIGQIERGEKNLSFGNLVKISTVLDVTPSELLSVLDGVEREHRSEPTQKGGLCAAQSARRVREIQKTLKRLKHQRDAMDHTMAVLEELAANPTTPSRTKMKQVAIRKK